MFRRLFGESKSRDDRGISSSSGSRTGGNDEETRRALRTIQQLQQSEEMMNKKLDKYDQDILDIQNQARLCLTKPTPDRAGAMRFIKRRKQLEQQRDKLWKMKENIQLVNEQVQASHFNRQVTDSLNIGQQQLKRAQKLMPTKKIEDLMDNLAEEMEASNEINDLLAQPIPVNDVSAMDLDLESELKNLDEELLRENLTEVNLPNAHTGTIKIAKPMVKDVDQQLAELQRLTTG